MEDVDARDKPGHDGAITLALSCLTTAVHANRGIFDLRDLMVRSARSARLEPWAAGTVARGPSFETRGHASRLSRLAHYWKPISGKPEIGGRAPQDEAASE